MIRIKSALDNKKPATLGDVRVLMLGKTRKYRYLERVKGIEPSYEAWEAAVLPLNYTRVGTKL